MRISPPVRARHRRTFEVAADADTVFALMCPVRECDWLESWRPANVYSASGVAEAECVFTSHDDKGESTWLIADYNPKAHRIRLVKFTPEFTVCLLEIDIAAGSATNCAVSVCYSYTALSEQGARFVAAFDEDQYREIMSQWKKAIQYYLEHGKAMPGT